MDPSAAAALLGKFLEAGLSMVTLLDMQLLIQYLFKPMTSWDLASDRGGGERSCRLLAQASFQARVFPCSDKKAKKKKEDPANPRQLQGTPGRAPESPINTRTLYVIWIILFAF
ncbi:hypothetical protein FCULG_00004146 [Fusarium culmorum]|uniref:Uncharacterized protein n=1 Tax=Fusarium culmorum TaxID=5516 RepID=A0A2T4HBU2_FUSCU|nr:hypothetical protein FCULG_00004146 [Fusarium culmorum]